MADWETLKSEVDARTDHMQSKLSEFNGRLVDLRDELVTKIEAAKQDDIFKMLKELGTRLSEIERRLPSEEDNESAAMPNKIPK